MDILFLNGQNGHILWMYPESKPGIWLSNSQNIPSMEIKWIAVYALAKHMSFVLLYVGPVKEMSQDAGLEYFKNFHRYYFFKSACYWENKCNVQGARL